MLELVLVGLLVELEVVDVELVLVPAAVLLDAAEDNEVD